MKTQLNRFRHSIAFRLVLCFTFVLVASLGLTHSAQGAGVKTHTVFVEKAIERLAAEGGYQELIGILNAYPGIVNYGAIFPDLTFNGVDNDWANFVHDDNVGYTNYGKYLQYLAANSIDKTNIDLTASTYKAFLNDPNSTAVNPPYRAALIGQLIDHLTHTPRTVEDKKTIAFLFGLIAHQEADWPWHWTASGNEWLGVERTAEKRWGELKYNADGTPYYYVNCWFILAADIGLNRAEVCLDLAMYKTLDGKPNYQFNFINTIRTDVIAAAGAIGQPEPECGVFCDPFTAGKNQINWLFNAYWLNDSNVWHYARLQEWENFAMTHKPGGVNYGAAYIAGAWMHTWDLMGSYTPVTTIELKPAQPDGSNGWYRQPVEITLEPSGDFFGIDTGPFVTEYSLNNGPSNKYTEPITLSADGIYELSLYSTDSQGISESPQNLTIKIDQTPPNINGAATTSPNINGWYNTDVTVHFTAEDALSGIDTLTPDQVLSTEGAGQTVEGTAVDLAGNSASFTVSGINIDKTPPTISGAPTTSPNSHGWYNTNVTVHFTATDALSGIDTLTPDQVLSAEGTGQSVTGTAVDKAGNSASATVSGINIDKTAPVITITSPEAITYLNTATPLASWSVTDALSGVDTQSATLNGKSVANGSALDLLMLPPGSYTLTVSATDKAGNPASKSVTFEVTVDLNGLVAVLERMCTQETISKKGTCNELSAKLSAAMAAVERGKLTPAVNVLEAFQNAVEAQTGKSIPEDSAGLLLKDSDFIIEKLSQE